MQIAGFLMLRVSFEPRSEHGIFSAFGKVIKSQVVAMLAFPSVKHIFIVNGCLHH